MSLSNLNKMQYLEVLESFNDALHTHKLSTFNEYLPLIKQSLENHSDYPAPSLSTICNHDVKFSDDTTTMIHLFIDSLYPFVAYENKVEQIKHFIYYAEDSGGLVGKELAYDIIDKLIKNQQFDNAEDREKIAYAIGQSPFLGYLPQLIGKGFEQDERYFEISLEKMVAHEDELNGEVFFDTLVNTSEKKVTQFLSQNSHNHSLLDLTVYYGTSLKLFKKLVFFGARFIDEELNNYTIHNSSPATLETYHNTLIEIEKNQLESRLAQVKETKKVKL